VTQAQFKENRMSERTVRADARTLPEATTRRAALGAIIAAGAAGATAVLPAAATRAIAPSEPYEDAALFALLTQARALDVLQNEVDDAETAAWDRMIRPDRPSALNPRPDDNSLLRPRRAEFDWRDIRELRGLVEGMEKLGPDTTINPFLMREMKTRGREIVDTWDSYQADYDRAKEAVDLPAVDRRAKELNDQRRQLWSQIAQTPARTVEGMHAKVAFAVSFNVLEREDFEEGTVDEIVLSAAMDYADLHVQEARA
jgi:hypothetical protein